MPNNKVDVELGDNVLTANYCKAGTSLRKDCSLNLLILSTGILIAGTE